MLRRTTVLLIPLGLLVVFSGCDRRGDRVRVRTVERGHVCGPRCATHFHDGTNIVIADRHRHGPGCGHHWNGDNWVVVTTRAPRVRGHRCGIDCNHHYDGDRVVQLPSHVHGRGCGHVYNGNRWVVADVRGRSSVREPVRTQRGSGNRVMTRERVR
ncbi:MAG: hypothetical protein AB7N71_10105 [Phycisphaerae bacterium]